MHISQHRHPRPSPTGRLAGHVVCRIEVLLADRQESGNWGADCSAFFLQFFFLLGGGLTVGRIAIPSAV